MQTVLIIIHLLIVIALTGVVLLQRSEGGGLGMGGGGSSGTGGFMTGRGQASALTRATAVLAGLFFATSLGLAVLAGYQRAPTSVFDSMPLSAPPNQPSVPGSGPAPAGPGILEQLDGMQAPAPGAPQVPQSR